MMHGRKYIKLQYKEEHLELGEQEMCVHFRLGTSSTVATWKEEQKKIRWR